MITQTEQRPGRGVLLTSRPSIVLVHDGVAEATGWQHVIRLLRRGGYTVTAVQNPLTSLADDIATAPR
jgi:hypothetical protein